MSSLPNDVSRYNDTFNLENVLFRLSEVDGEFFVRDAAVLAYHYWAAMGCDSMKDLESETDDGSSVHATYHVYKLALGEGWIRTTTEFDSL